MLSRVMIVIAYSVASHGYVYMTVGVSIKSESMRYRDPAGSPAEDPEATRLRPISQLITCSSEQVYANLLDFEFERSMLTQLQS